MALTEWLIVAVALLDLLFVIVLIVVGLRFKALADRGRRSVEPLLGRGKHLAETGGRLAVTVKTRSESIRSVLQALADDVRGKVATTRRIVTEVVHPNPPALDTTARALERGREWSERLSRLRRAAHVASGGNGHPRRRV
jgi:hypothetical protein